MKLLLKTLFVFLFSVASFSQPNYQQVSQQLFIQGKTFRDRLVVKVKDQPRGKVFDRFTFADSFEKRFSISAKMIPLVSSHVSMRADVLSRYYYFYIDHQVGENLAKKLIHQVSKHPEVELAYWEPRTSLPGGLDQGVQIESAPMDRGLFSTPDFADRQFYLEASPKGVGLSEARKWPGGRGENVKVIDIEIGWQVDHEDFSAPFYTHLQNEVSDHGTAVWGIVAAQDNGEGVIGLAPDCQFGGSSVLWEGTLDGYVPNLLGALDKAIAQLEAGDVLIIEQQAPGPNNSKVAPVEYWPAVFDAMTLATQKGIHVVAAAGNGNSNLDHPDYQGAFDRAIRDSGAILVGAAGSPLRNQHHKRMSYSNYGGRLDSFGYGQDMTSTGYGDLYNRGDQRVYTKDFAGTSSATPLVAGVVALVSSIYQERGVLLAPHEMRELVKKNGLKQKDQSKKNIGRFPVLKETLK